MGKWTKHVIEVKGFPVKVYINQNNTQAYVFPLFGRCFGLNSDVSALDFATDFLLGDETKTITFSAYIGGMEDTAVIQIDNIAA